MINKKEVNIDFLYKEDFLKEIILKCIFYAKSFGSINTSVRVVESNNLLITVRNRKVELISYNQNKKLTISTVINKRFGSSSTSDFSLKSLINTALTSCDISKYTSLDNCIRFAKKEVLGYNPIDLCLYHPWNININEMVDIAKYIECSAFDTSKKIKNSDGVNISTKNLQFFLGTSSGFLFGYPCSRHSISCFPIAEDVGEMQSDNWNTIECDYKKLLNPRLLGNYSALRALSKLGSRSLKTCNVPVLFEAPIALSLLDIFVRAINGNLQYKGTSFLNCCINKKVFSDHIQIFENPHILCSVGSSPFDDEGVSTKKRFLVKNGIVKGYFLSTYSACKLNMDTTGHYEALYNLYLYSSLTNKSDNFNEMLNKLNTGLLVTGLIGQGVNYITGDYSHGAFGFWVEKGIIKYPVEEITIAGMLQNIYKNIMFIGSDVITKGYGSTGSILINKMTVSGKI